MYSVVQLKCVGVILLSYRRDKQMRLGSRAPTALRTCCETKLIFETSAGGDAAGQASIVTPCKQMIEIPPKLLHILESSRKPKCTHVWFGSFSILCFRRGVKKKSSVRRAEQFEVAFYDTPCSAMGDLTILSPVRHGVGEDPSPSVWEEESVRTVLVCELYVHDEFAR